MMGRNQLSTLPVTKSWQANIPGGQLVTSHSDDEEQKGPSHVWHRKVPENCSNRVCSKNVIKIVRIKYVRKM